MAGDDEGRGKDDESRAWIGPCPFFFPSEHKLRS